MPSISLASSLRSNLLSTLADAYSIQGLSPAVVSDFTKNYFRNGNTDSNFASTFDYTGASLKTMTDSDGKLKWGPHNLLLQSAALNTASWTLQGATTTASTLTEDTTTGIHRVIQNLVITAGTPITFRATVSASATRRLYLNLDVAAGIRILYDINAGSVVNTVSGSGSIVNNGNGTFTITASGVATGNVSGNVFLQLNRASSGNATDDFYLGDGVSGLTITNMHVFRSDLGGMVNNPDTGNSYVPTTTSAVYLPRRGNHLYNGYAWVNKGLLLESQARTNLLVQSNTFNVTWTQTPNLTISAAATVSPDGNTNGWLWTRTTTSAGYVQQNTSKAASAITYTASFYVKKSVGDYCALRVQGNYPSRADVIFNLATGTISTAASVSTNFTSPSASIQNAGNGWYRVSLTATSDSITSIAPVISFNSNNVQIDGTDSVSNSAGFIYGAQFEQAATPSSYIPTTTASVTRAAELLQVKAPNLAVGANDFTNTLAWPTTKTSNGVTATKGAVGFEDGSPWVEYRYTGTPIAATVEVGFVDVLSRNPSSIGDTWTSSFIGRRVGGTLTGVTGLRAAIISETAPSTFISNSFGAVTPAETDTVIFATATTAAGNQVRFGMFVAVTIGVAIDVTYRFRGLQFNKAASRVTYPDQSNISMQIDGTMTGTPSTFTRWGGSLTNYLMQSASVGAYEFDTYVNLALGADDFTNTTYWPSSSTQSGITATNLSRGIDTDGLPYVDARYQGLSTGTFQASVYSFNNSITPATVGQTYTASAICKILSGSFPSGVSVNVSVVETTSTNSYIVDTQSVQVPTTVDTLLSATRTLNQGTMANTRTAIALLFPVGTVIDVTIRIKGLQFDKAASRLTYAVRGGSFTSGIDVPFNVASRHGATYINGAVNGTALTASSSTLPFPVLNASPIQLGPTFMGNIGDFRQWNTDVGNAGIVAASNCF